MFRSPTFMSFPLCLAILGCRGASLLAQSPANSMPALPRLQEGRVQTLAPQTSSYPAEASRKRGQKIFHWFHHVKHVPACASCVAVPSTTKTTDYSYETKRNVICYTKERCSCFKCLFRFHDHHAECEPEIVPVVKRQLIKHKITEEKKGTKYEGSLLPAPEPSVEAVAPCRLHGPGCLGHR